MENREYEYVLELQDICKSFPGVKALDHVSMRVKLGTVHALIGENGAGKSTLIKCINGLYIMDSGKIIYKGRETTPQSPSQMLNLGIATIPQEICVVPTMTVAENMFLNREPRTVTGTVDYKRMYAETAALMREFELRYKPQAKMGELKLSDMQLLEIVKNVSRGASLIIMDEPTSSITESETELLFRYVRRLRESGISIIYISHRMEEIFEICDEVTIFRDGQWVHTSPISEIDRVSIIKKMVGREITNVYPKEAAPSGDTVLELKGLNKKGVFHDVDFSVRAGEIVGIAGLIGAGRSEVFRTVYGLDPYDSGEVLINGEPVSVKTVRNALDNGIVMTSEDRRREGVVLYRSVKENISLANIMRYFNGFVIDRKKESEDALNLVRRLKIKVVTYNDMCAGLSGGNQQKVVLAKSLLLAPKVLILDEPTRGIDVGAKYEIYTIMCELAAQGVAIVMISSDLPEVLGMSDRVVVMSNGTVTGELSKAEAHQESVMNLAMKGF